MKNASTAASYWYGGIWLPMALPNRKPSAYRSTAPAELVENSKPAAFSLVVSMPLPYRSRFSSSPGRSSRPSRISGAAAWRVRKGEIGNRQTPSDLGHLAHRDLAVAGDVVGAGDAVEDDGLHATDDVLLGNELDQGIEAGDARHHAPGEIPADRRVDLFAEHVGEPEEGDGHVGVLVGEIPHVALDLGERALEA